MILSILPALAQEITAKNAVYRQHVKITFQPLLCTCDFHFCPCQYNIRPSIEWNILNVLTFIE